MSDTVLDSDKVYRSMQSKKYYIKMWESKKLNKTFLTVKQIYPLEKEDVFLDIPSVFLQKVDKLEAEKVFKNIERGY